MNRRPWLATAVLAATGFVGLAGCGSSSTSSPSTAASSGAANSTGSETTSSSSSSVPSIPGGGSGSFCAQATSVIAQVRQLGASLAPAGSTPEQQLANLKQLMAADARAIDSLASSVPSDIAADFETLRAAFDQANSNVQAATTAPQLETAIAPLEAPAVKTASDHLNNYGKTVCGITSATT